MCTVKDERLYTLALFLISSCFENIFITCQLIFSIPFPLYDPLEMNSLEIKRLRCLVLCQACLGLVRGLLSSTLAINTAPGRHRGQTKMENISKNRNKF